MTLAFLDHHLDNWHAKVFLKLLRERGHDVVAYETAPKEGDWCAANGVRRAESVDEAVDASDAVMILAPDDIEAHLELCLAAIPAGKPIWIDKLLAPTVDEAERILRAAEYHSTPVTAGSSLRHTAELEEALAQCGVASGELGTQGSPLPTPHSPFDEAFFSGYGAWERYGVHTVAMALRAFGGGVRRIVNVGTAAMPVVTLEWADGRRASLVVAQGEGASAAFPWRFALRHGGAYVHGTVTRFDEFYERQCEAILRDFAARTSHDRAEMLDTAKILAVAPTATVWTDL